MASVYQVDRGLLDPVLECFAADDWIASTTWLSADMMVVGSERPMQGAREAANESQ